MELKHGVVLAGKPWNQADTEPAVQEHLDQHTGAGWTLEQHSAAAYVDPSRCSLGGVNHLCGRAGL